MSSEKRAQRVASLPTISDQQAIFRPKYFIDLSGCHVVLQEAEHLQLQVMHLIQCKDVQLSEGIGVIAGGVFLKF